MADDERTDGAIPGDSSLRPGSHANRPDAANYTNNTCCPDCSNNACYHSYPIAETETGTGSSIAH